jgi:hypothetical protein
MEVNCQLKSFGREHGRAVEGIQMGDGGMESWNCRAQI